jgi:hypothetical protein
MPTRLIVALKSGSPILTLSVGLRQVFGLFLIPITQDLSVARETFGLVVSLQNLIWGISQPIAGYSADPLAPRASLSWRDCFTLEGSCSRA